MDVHEVGGIEPGTRVTPEQYEMLVAHRENVLESGDAVIDEQIPDQIISWKAEGEVTNAGKVTFDKAKFLSGLPALCKLLEKVGETPKEIRIPKSFSSIAGFAALSRRTINIEFVQEQTVANKRRLEEKDPARRRQRLGELAAIAGDRARHRDFLRRTSLLDSVDRARTID